MQIVPSAFKETLLWLHRNYNQPEIVIAENGFCDDGSLNDDDRIAYFKVILSISCGQCNIWCFCSCI